MNNPNFTVIAFYTSSTPYEDVFYQYLQPSLIKFSIPYIIKTIENKGSWLKNVAEKPRILLESLEENPNIENFVHLDVDAEILEYPSLFDTIGNNCDFGCHYLNWWQWYGHSPGVKELLSGTLFLKNNDKIKVLLKDWSNYSLKYDRWEQAVLEKVIKLHTDLKIYELPLSYIYIKTLPGGQKPRINVENPVIVHNQISRKMKKIIRR